MAETTYTYSKANDFPGGDINPGKLIDEITASGSGITIQPERIDVVGDVVDCVFKDALPAAEKTAFDGDTTGPSGGLIAAHDNTPTPDDTQTVAMENAQFSPSGFLKAEIEPREGNGQNFYAPNLCDQSTWYEGATPITEFELSSSDDTIWDTAGTHDDRPWVDLVHGKLFREDDLIAATPSLRCKVEVSTDGGTTWVEKTENSIGSTTDGGYSVDYQLCKVTFNSALNSGDKVRASFSISTESMLFTIKPNNGDKIRITEVETQISKDCGFTASVEYEIWAYDINDLPNKMLVAKSVYKSVSDFLYESNGVYPIFPKIDEAGPRGLSQDIIVVPFKYITSRDLLSGMGLEIRMKVSEPFTGLLCTSTFYCLQEAE
jgi:hypothetical protein